MLQTTARWGSVVLSNHATERLWFSWERGRLYLQVCGAILPDVAIRNQSHTQEGQSYHKGRFRLLHDLWDEILHLLPGGKQAQVLYYYGSIIEGARTRELPYHHGSITWKWQRRTFQYNGKMCHQVYNQFWILPGMNYRFCHHSPVFWYIDSRRTAATTGGSYERNTAALSRAIYMLSPASSSFHRAHVMSA